MKKAEYRPQIHFSPKSGWMNDPNGLVYENGNYHLFFQHNPAATHFGPMHWGHALSKDLLHWEQLPMAMVPDDLGVIFSGSAVMDTENISGFGKDGKTPMILMYTSHNVATKAEQQCIAYSLDYEHFEKYEGNPVIRGTAGVNSRDPQLFYNPVRKCFSMVLATEDKVTFYATNDFKTWEETGYFKAGEHGIAGICECPDCFPVKTPSGEEKWIMIISMIVPEHELRKCATCFNRSRHITQYYIGDFDGDTFIDTEMADEPLLIDYGTDNYAGVTYFGSAEPTLISWGDNWDYANDSPPAEEGFQGKMTLPRKLRLVDTDKGLRLATTFCGLDNHREKKELHKEQNIELKTQTFGVLLKGSGEIVLRNDFGDNLSIEINENKYIVDRRTAGKTSFSGIFASDRASYIEVARNGNSDETEIIFDRCIMEILGDGGLTPISINVYPHEEYKLIEVKGKLQTEFYDII